MKTDLTIVKLRKQCFLKKLPRECSVFQFTSGKCNGCGNNLKQLGNIKTNKNLPPFKNVEIL
jgi:hypothetical protein